MTRQTHFSNTLIEWYHPNKRDLPFRKTKDPYKIWLSEIILQQTRVAQGLPYYKKFIRLFPTIHHLAGAEGDAVMKTWQGLGYYSRARNLHDTAKYISINLNGKFPDNYSDLKKLKGVGDYTASAIASLAFNQPHAVVDGNVYRVLARCFGITTPIDSPQGKIEFKMLAEKLLDKNNPGDFNQAMELGALQCVPANPDCTTCPLQKQCVAHAKEMVDQLPIKTKKTKIKVRYFNYLVVFNEEKICLRKRIEKDIWKNLYDFPVIESDEEVNDLTQLMKSKKISSSNKINIARETTRIKHILSHQIIQATFWRVSSIPDKKYIATHQLLYIKPNQLKKYAFSNLARRYLEKHFAQSSVV
jgi:A/G-specific adenine glycosylase